MRFISTNVVNLWVINIFITMTEKKKEIIYRELSYGELSEKDVILAERAIKAVSGAYAPYSHFNVGAALRLGNGEVLIASNQENVAYPSGMCAERSLLYYTHSNYPNEPIEAIAITAFTNGKIVDTITYPCGACRQVMIEAEKRSGNKIKVLILSKDKIEEFDSIEAFMPFSFSL